MEVLYFGPITPLGQPSQGGFEAANRKNIDALRKRGIEVDEYPNPIINHKFGALGKLAYAKMLFRPFYLLKYIGRKDVIIHTTPLYGNALAFPDNLTIKLAKSLHIPTVVDIRAGSFFHCYERGNLLVRWEHRNLISDSTVIAVESTEYIAKIREVFNTDKHIFYFPNVALCGEIAPIHRKRDSINLFYFGSIKKEKGVGLMFQVIDKLGDGYKLYLAGGVSSGMRAELDGRNRVKYLGKLTYSQLKATMKDMHIFIFPTRHPGEGQSNSLIEAMAEGLIPLTSTQGFCQEVVADCGICIPIDGTAEDYVRGVKRIVGQDLDSQAAKCQEHIKSCHNIDVEIDKLVTIYRKLICE